MGDLLWLDNGDGIAWNKDLLSWDSPKHSCQCVVFLQVMGTS